MSRAPISRSQIHTIKAGVKTDLDQILESSGHEAKLDHALKSVANLTESTNLEDRVKAFVYCLSALVAHERQGGLSIVQTKSLVKTSEQLLATFDINSKKSPLADLHSELHLIHSQIQRQAGDQIGAAWSSALAEVSCKQPIGGESFQTLTKANRLFRLGDAGTAAQMYLKCAPVLENGHLRGMACLGRIKSLRLNGKFEDCRSELRAMLTREDIDEHYKRDIAWEDICLDMQSDRELGAGFEAVKECGSHFHASYIIEVILWARAAPTAAGADKLLKVSTYQRKKELDFAPYRDWVAFARVIEQCYDNSVPLEIRVQALGEQIAGLNRLITIDKELLALAAATRWLASIKSDFLTDLCLNQYMGRCLQLSRGANTDLLQVLGDIHFSAS